MDPRLSPKRGGVTLKAGSCRDGGNVIILLHPYPNQKINSTQKNKNLRSRTLFLASLKIKITFALARECYR